MKRTMLRVATAAAMAIGVIVPTAAVPAQADVGTVIGVIKQIYSIYQQFTQGQSALQTAVQQIEAAIQSAQNTIIGEIDQVAAANVRGCAESAVINFADITRLSPDNLQVFAFNTTDCVTQANALIPALSNKAAVDEVGVALDTVAPLAVLARAEAGLTTTSLKTVVVSAENSLRTSLLPDCERQDATGGEPGAGHFFVWDCNAYNGNNGNEKRLIDAQNEAARNTTWVLVPTVIANMS